VGGELIDLGWIFEVSLRRDEDVGSIVLVV
jgi:hypothetical protein